MMKESENIHWKFFYSRFSSLFIGPRLLWGPWSGPPMGRPCLEKTSEGPKISYRSLQKISGRYAQR